MPSKPQISTLPPPATLALPLVDDAKPQVRIGNTVAAGDLLASGAYSADILAPQHGRVTAFARRPLAGALSAEHTSDALCIIIDTHNTAEATATLPAPTLPALPALPLPQLLKRAGIVGMGGGAFPAWRKWRRGIRWFIANGMESDSEMRHDATLMQTRGDTLTTRVAAVAQAYGATPLLALPAEQEDTPSATGVNSETNSETNGAINDAIIRRLPPHYAAGNERLLIASLCNLQIPPDSVPADHGVICHNIATVLAIADAIIDRRPTLSRLLTVYTGDDVRILRVPFGASIGDVRQHLGISGALAAGGADERRDVPDNAVIHPATTLLRPPPPPRQALPCIRCGDCEPACPVALSPLQLFALAQDGRDDDIAANGVSRCLACRHCDDVCPSNIALTATFVAQKHRIAARHAAQTRATALAHRHDKHSQRAQATARPKRMAKSALSAHVAAAVAATKSNHQSPPETKTPAKTPAPQ